jgi:[ribosomal protein S5]-alanine N-acetyltransferase
MLRDTITTARLTLRPFSQEHLAALVALAGDLRVARNLSRMPHPYTEQDGRDWLDRQPEMWAGGRDYVYAVELNGSGLIGAVGLHRDSRMSLDGSEAWELGYWFGVPFWGQGYATEAARAVLDGLEAVCGPTPVTAGYATHNTQSGHVLEKLGFHKTGVVRTSPVLALGIERDTALMFRPAAPRMRSDTP